MGNKPTSWDESMWYDKNWNKRLLSSFMHMRNYTTKWRDSRYTSSVPLKVLWGISSNYLCLKRPKCWLYCDSNHYVTVRNVDHINPGFVLSGMTSNEVPRVTFQMVDISDKSPTTQVLQKLLLNVRGKIIQNSLLIRGEYPFLKSGVLSLRGFTINSKPHKGNQNSELFTLYTSDPTV